MKTYITAIILVTLGMATRFLPHPANFTAITALALFSGLYLPRVWAITLPVITMFLSDIIIGFYSLPIMVTVYASFIASSLIGSAVRKRKNIGTIAGATLASSVLFFLATNAAVWAFGTMYPHTLAGLFENYYMALPFFKNSLLGDLFYTTLLVGGMEGTFLLQSKQLPNLKTTD